MTTLNAVQQQIFEQVIALRAITRTTGAVTRRSQKALLQPLSDGDLIAVSLALTEYERSGQAPAWFYKDNNGRGKEAQ